MLLGSAGLASGGDLISNISKFGFHSLQEIAVHPKMHELFGQIFAIPSLPAPKLNPFAAGVCKGSQKLPCSLAFFPIRSTQAEVHLQVGSRLIRSRFALENLAEGFDIFRQDLLKLFNEALAQELQNPILNFEELLSKAIGGIRSACPNCQIGQDNSSKASVPDAMVLKVGLPTKKMVKEKATPSQRMCRCQPASS